MNTKAKIILIIFTLLTIIGVWHKNEVERQQRAILDQIGAINQPETQSNQPQQQASTNTSSASSYSTWVWDADNIVGNENSDSLINFCRLKKVNKIYLQISTELGSSQMNTIELYNAFVSKANRNGIYVYALDGSSSWSIESTSDGQADNLFTWLSAYNNSGSTKFAGLQLDVEPYTLPEWSDNKQTVINSYKRNIASWYSSARGLGLNFSVCIPRWYDSLDDKTLLDHIIQNSDSIVVMDYTDNSSSIIEDVSTEFQKALQYGKKVTIAVETINIPDTPQTSFYEEGEAYMQSELQKVYSAYSHNPALDSIAIHHYKTWKSMRP